MSVSLLNSYSKEIDNYVLIDEVKARPALYDRTVKEYCDIQFKKAMWEEIYAILYPDTWHKMSETQREIRGREIIKRWNNLRTCFSRELKIMRDPLTQKRRKYVYFNKLMFLLDGNSPHDQSQDQDAQEAEANFIFTKSNSSLDKFEEESTFLEKSPLAEKSKDIANIKAKTKQWKPKERRRKDVEKYVQYSINKLKEEIDFKNRTEEIQVESVPKTFETDADANFALSLVPTLKMVPLNKKIDAQIEILSILKKYTSKDSSEENIVKFEREDDQSSEVDDDSEIISLFGDDK